MTRSARLAWFIGCVLLAALPAAAQDETESTPPPSAPADAVAVRVPAAGSYFMELTATIPQDRGRQTIRHTVWVDGAQVQYKPRTRPRGKPWNVGYVPYFTVKSTKTGPAAADEPAELLFLEQLNLSADAKLAVHAAPGERILATRLRPALSGIEASVTFSGDSQQVYFPEEQPRATIELQNLPAGRPLSGRILVQRLRLADTWGDSWWRADIRVVEVAHAASVPLDRMQRSGDRATLTIPLPVDQHGVLGITAIVEQGDAVWARYLGAAAIVPERPLDRAQPDGLFIASLADQFRNGQVRSSEPMPLEAMAAVYKKIGIDWVRCGPNWAEFEPQQGQFAWKGTDELFGVLRRHGLLAMHLAQNAPTWARPDDDPRLQPTKYKNLTIKVDWAPSPAFLPRWQQAHEQLYRRYKDVIRAANVWNEPWEGMGITGWKSTGAHYRALVQGIRDAVDRADPTILVVAADSGHNTDWKLFAAGMADRIDAISTHYTSPRSAAFAMARHYKKQLWETETWWAWAGDAASVRHTLYYLANGGDKISLWNYRMLFDHERNPLPSTAWTAGVRHMLDGLRFRQMVCPERPPFVLLFENARGQDRHVAAVMSTLASGVRGFDGEFRSQFAHGRSRMTLQAHPGLRVLDLLANPLPLGVAEDGTVQLTVDPEPRFIESREPIEQFIRRLESAVHTDLRPVEIVLTDITRPIGGGATVNVALRNAYPQPLEAEVTLSARGLRLAEASQKVTLPPAGTQQLAIAVESIEPAAANAYPVTVHVRTPVGEATHDETIHLSLIARGTPQVDGDLGEWPALGAVPVDLAATGAARRDEQLDAWFPWEQFAAAEGFAAQVAFAADERCLYLMARVRDASPRPLPSMIAGRNLHVMQSPPADNVYLKAGPIPGDTGDMIQLALGPLVRKQYLPAEELYPPDHPLRRAGSYLSTPYKYLLYPTAEGGAEVMRVRTPSFYYRHPLPIDYGFLREHCRVEGAQVIVRPMEGGWIYEAAIPWSELAEVPHAPGDRILMSFLVQNDQIRNRLEWSAGRSSATTTDLDFEPGWGVKWSSETEWGFAPPSAP